MASPLKTGKQSVDLAAPAVRVSRIRRDPPPVVKEVTVQELREREAWEVVLGVLLFALAIFVIVIAFSSWAGWSPRQITLDV